MDFQGYFLDYNLLSILLLSLTTSIDNFSIGISFSIINKHITIYSNLIIAILNALTTLVTMLLGIILFFY